MHFLYTILFCFLVSLALGQTKTQAISNYAPTAEYSNVHSKTLHSDDNTTVYLIFIKQGVRKHLHQYHTEVITVLAGRGRMFMGGEYFNIKKGDYIIVPPNTPHAVITTSARPLQVLSMQTPEFQGQDRIWLEDELNTEVAEKAEVAKPVKKKKRKKKKRKNDIPEFEGEYD